MATTAPERVDVVNASNITTKFRDAFEVYDPVKGNRWLESRAPGDLIFLDGNAASASYLVISKDPLSAGTESSIETRANWRFTMPVEIAVGLSMSQRTLGQEVALEAVDVGAPLPDVPDIEIASIVQSGSTLTVTTVQPHGLSIGKSTGIRAVDDARLNYPAIVVASVPLPNQFTATAGPGGNLPSVTAYTGLVLAATTAALPAATYANGTAGVGATLTANANGAFPSIDGVAIPLGARVLVKNQAAALENGIYTLTTAGSAGAAWVLTRATDFDQTAEMTVVANALYAVTVAVASGATQALRKYYLTATVTTVGTTAVAFAEGGTPGPVGFVYFRERLGRAHNGVAEIFENVTATNASLYVRSESGDALPSGTVAGNHSSTVGTTASTQLVNSAYTYAFAPSTEFRLLLQSDRVQWADSTVDATAQMAARGTRTQVCPNPNDEYKLRVRANNNKSLTVPNRQIVSVSKTGTTTATVICDGPHGYVAGDPIVAYGTRDQTNFANLTTATPVVSVVDPNTFTIVWGAAVTATTFGGYVAKVQGGNLMSALGANVVVAQSAVLSTLADGTRQLVLTGNTNWANLAIGDMAEAVGVRDAVSGVSLGVDGPWKVANFSTTALTLVLPYAGQRELPADFGSINCGGGIIRRTCTRLSFVRIFDYERLRVEAMNRPASDAAAAFPVAIQNTPAVTVSSGTVTTVTTVATVSAITGGGAAEDAAAGANPVVTGGVVRTAAAPTTLVAGDAARHTMTSGAQLNTKPYGLPETDWTYTGTLTTTTAVAARAAGAAGIRNYVTDGSYQNTGAVATTFVILDGSTVLHTVNAPASMANPVPLTFPTPKRGSAATALNINCGTAGANLIVNLGGYQAP